MRLRRKNGGQEHQGRAAALGCPHFPDIVGGRGAQARRAAQPRSVPAISAPCVWRRSGPSQDEQQVPAAAQGADLLEQGKSFGSRQAIVAEHHTAAAW